VQKAGDESNRLAEALARLRRDHKAPAHALAQPPLLVSNLYYIWLYIPRTMTLRISAEFIAQMRKCAAKNAINFRHALLLLSAAIHHLSLRFFACRERDELVLSVVKLKRRRIFSPSASFCTFFANFELQW
jgi:hypothetical protein